MEIASAMETALDLADNWLGLSRVELTVFTDNATAIALYEKFGFEIEATHRRFACACRHLPGEGYRVESGAVW